MKKSCQTVIITLLFLFVLSCTKKPPNNYLTLNVQGDEPSDWITAMSLDLEDVSFMQGGLPYNSPKKLFQEIQNEQAKHLIASSTGLSQEELNAVVITFDLQEDFYGDFCVGFFLTHDNELILDSLYNTIEMYLENRFDGHSKKYMAAVLNQKNSNEDLEDAGLKDLLEIYPNLPPTWIKKIDEEMVGVEKGEARQVNYIIIDGDIVWRKAILYNPDGSVEKCIWGSYKVDAKEYEPKYKKVIEEVENAVRKKMERENIIGLGSCHTLFKWKKEYLKNKGIDWKSPSELNPNIPFD